MTQFALIPDDLPPRVVRFVRGGILPANTLAMLDTRRNVLLVDHRRYLRLAPPAQHALLRTGAALVTV